MISRLTPSELQQRLTGGDARPVVLDVREPWECKVCALPNSLRIPMGQILARAGELQKGSEIVVICHHGIRSQQVANFLKQMGFNNLSNLAGGIDAWARDIEPTMARY